MYIEDSFIKSVQREPLDWQKAGLQFTATGYGTKIPSDLTVSCSDGRKRRIYYTTFSNVASHWIKVKGKKMFFHDWQLSLEA